jgi:predicted enzyme related to lactoylglutathione lyase
MAKVLGIGGIFFKSADPQSLNDWYIRWLGLDFGSDTAMCFYPQTMPGNGYTVWSPFKSTTTYFEPSGKEFMFNLIVDDLEEALKQVKDGGAQIVGDIQNLKYGRFAWFMDPDGNKVELWEPTK